ncbi:hypothetical protein NL676_020521 [Syzygium grande]|nr:hypothetical protein NL676_020521 [Syzygium grande]
MSYRGKKSKRNISEVMRHIIEEYMEEIKQAGGIGCFEKGAPAGVQSNEVPSADAIPANGTFELCYEPEGYPVYSQRGLRTNHDVTSTSNVIGDNYSEHGKSRGRIEREDAELTIEKHQEIKRSYSGRSYRGEDSSSSRSDVGGNDWSRDSRDRRWQETRGRHNSDFPLHDFEDRYDPYKSDDLSEE